MEPYVYRCVKCDEPMDEGRLAGSDSLGYVSLKQKGMLRQATMINRVYACAYCGYVELFLDPRELKQRLG